MEFVSDESKREQKLRWGDASGSFTDTVLLCELNSLSLSYRFGKISGSVNYFLTLKSSYFNRRGKKTYRFNADYYVCVFTEFIDKPRNE